MPYTNEWSARLAAPENFSNFFRKNNLLGKGIHAVFGVKPGGGSRIQSLRFDKNLFSKEEVRRLMNEKNNAYLTIEGDNMKFIARYYHDV
jgi:hypothetical protein